MNMEEWFQWLAAFTGIICRRYPGMELRALLQYLVNQLKSTESLDLLVLKEILTAMTVRLTTKWGGVPCEARTGIGADLLSLRSRKARGGSAFPAPFPSTCTACPACIRLAGAVADCCLIAPCRSGVSLGQPLPSCYPSRPAGPMSALSLSSVPFAQPPTGHRTGE